MFHMDKKAPESLPLPEEKLTRINTLVLTLPSDPKWVEALRTKLAQYEERDRTPNQQNDYCIIIMSRLLAGGLVSSRTLVAELMKDRPGEFNALKYSNALGVIDEYARLGFSGGKCLPGFRPKFEDLRDPTYEPLQEKESVKPHPESAGWRLQLWRMFGGS